jgi:pimeloyl-ACP methyl ester carboxylesterase
VDLCQGLGLDRIDLVGNDTGGAVAQIVAASHPELLRSLVLTNCDTEGNFPPQAFMPVIEAAMRGEIAPLLTVAAAHPAAARMSPLADAGDAPPKRSPPSSPRRRCWPRSRRRWLPGTRAAPPG